MKTQKLILSLLLGFMSFTGATAQTEIERRFTEKVDSLNELFYLKSKEDRFKDCEKISRNIIELYEEYSDKVSEGYSYFKYASYYNLACIQAKQGKKDEATASPLSTLK